jgi:hypothetical protein
VSAPASPEAPTAAHEVPTDDRVFYALVVGAGVVGTVAMAASASTLAALGHAVGWTQWDGRMAWALPVAVDALALVSGVAWLARSIGARARTLAQKVTLAAVVGSVGLNALGHVVESGDVDVTPLLRIGVSTVPPLVAAVAVHLVGVVLTGRQAGRREVSTDVDTPETEAPTVDTEPESWAPTLALVSTPSPSVPTDVDTADTEPVKLSEPEALAAVAEAYREGVSQREAGRRTGWSKGWVQKQYDALKTA